MWVRGGDVTVKGKREGEGEQVTWEGANGRDGWMVKDR